LRATPRANPYTSGRRQQAGQLVLCIDPSMNLATAAPNHFTLLDVSDGSRQVKMNRATLYFQLSVVWLVILAGGLAFLWFK
jgi:hypothetical protein